jgi:hypothetical protein
MVVMVETSARAAADRAVMVAQVGTHLPKGVNFNEWQFQNSVVLAPSLLQFGQCGAARN